MGPIFPPPGVHHKRTILHRNMQFSFTMLDLRRLRLLRELRDRGTVGAVAAALGYSPSAVSQQLRVLEAETDAALLERAGRRVRLTDAGRTLARHADRLLAAAEEAEAEVAAATGGVGGTVRIAAFQTATLALVPAALTSLAEAHPHLRVEVLEAEPEAALHALGLGELDLVIADEWEYVPRAGDEGLLREELLREGVRLVLPRDHPLARPGGAVPTAELAGAAWACGSPPSAHDRLVDRTCRTLGGFIPDVRHRSTDLLVLLALVRGGHAVTLLPDLVRAEEDPTLAVRDLAEGPLTRLVFTAVRTASANRPALRAVQAALREATPGRAQRSPRTPSM
jgi:DNA-binding transcriptional LysR family regulator